MLLSSLHSKDKAEENKIVIWKKNFMYRIV